MTTGKDAFLSAWQPRAHGVLRIILGFLFIAHGTQKVLGFPPSGRPVNLDLSTLAGWSGPLELVGGALILVGLLTRPVAFVLSGMMAVAYFQVHAPNGFWPIVNKGELAVIYCFLFLYFAVAGAGSFSLDSLFQRYKIEPVQEPDTVPETKPQLRPH